jgi:hypothetical protein
MSESSTGKLEPIEIDQLKIDQSPVLKEGKICVPYLKIAYLGNEKFLLKTSPFFVDKNNRILTKDEFFKLPDFPKPEELYRNLRRDLKGEHLAWLLAKHIGVTMADTYYVEIDGIPFVAYRFLEGAVDCGFGGLNLQFSRDPLKLKEQQMALAYGALFKFLIDARGDQGQYLQDREGKIYLSDIFISSDPSFNSVREAENLRSLLEQVMEQNFYTGYFATARVALEHQLTGISMPEFQKTLEYLEEISPSTIVKLISENPNNPSEDDLLLAEKIARRAHGARRIFNLLLKNKGDAICILNPIDNQTGKKTFDEGEVMKARASLLKKLQEENSAS